MRSFFGALFGPLLDHFWGPFWGPFWDQIGPRRGQDEPKRAIKSFKEPKSYIFKKWFSSWTVGILSLFRPPKRASRGPRRLPRGTQRAPKTQKKGIQKGNRKLAIFGPILGPFWGPFWGPKSLQKGSQKWTPKKAQTLTPKRNFQMGRLGGLSTPRQAPTSHTYAKKYLLKPPRRPKGLRCRPHTIY